jgi:hypothetical protein
VAFGTVSRSCLHYPLAYRTRAADKQPNFKALTADYSSAKARRHSAFIAANRAELEVNGAIKDSQDLPGFLFPYLFVKLPGFPVLAAINSSASPILAWHHR